MIGWTQNENGNFVTPDGYGVATIFQKPNGEWRVAYDGRFSVGAYESPEDAADAYEAGHIRWVDPYRWKSAKHGGCYRQDPERGILSVKRAKSGAWYWTGRGVDGAQGWYPTREAACDAADQARAKAHTADDFDLDSLLDGLD